MYYKNPVLLIIKSPLGISMQIVASSSNEIYFNNDGRKVKYIAKGLKCIALDKEQNKNQELEHNLLSIYQIPLIQAKPLKIQAKPLIQPDQNFCDMQLSQMFRPTVSSFDRFNYKIKCKDYIGNSNMEIGELDYGEFPQLDKNYLVRDTARPVRVTHQFYKITDSVEFSPSDLYDIYYKIKTLYSKKL